MKKQTRNLCIAAAAFIVLGGAYIALAGQQTEERATKDYQIMCSHTMPFLTIKAYPFDF